jgi:NTP pyrophosphatase (non-canonical NTP hydrolase)
MTGNEFQQHVLRTANTGLTDKEALSNACMGLAGEAGEYIDMVKKHIFHNHSLDFDKVEKELGDILFYVAWAANIHGIELDSVMKTNVDKLLKRYPNGFNTQDSLNRKDI